MKSRLYALNFSQRAAAAPEPEPEPEPSEEVLLLREIRDSLVAKNKSKSN